MTPLRKLINRDWFPAWLNENGLTGNGVEIGTFRKVARGPSGLVSIHQSIDPAEAEILRSMRGRHGLTQIDEAEYRALEKQAPRLR